ASFTESFTGEIPDYTAAPRCSYYPSISDFRQGDLAPVRALWEIPISTAGTRPELSALVPPAHPLSPADAPPPYEGFHDTADCRYVSGWVWNPERPGAPVDVDILDGQTYPATARADLYRADLRHAGKGAGNHAFRYAIPAGLRDGQPHTLRVRISGADFELFHTPRTITCAHDTCDETEQYDALNLANDPAWFTRAAADLLAGSDPGYLALITRTDTGSQPAALANVAENLEYLLSHTRARDLVFTTPTEMRMRVGGV
ncbi:MAG: hypothetical protein ACKV2V_21830, partial [Blastocatellia bacterium]